jgi:hypothetical protein
MVVYEAVSAKILKEVFIMDSGAVVVTQAMLEPVIDSITGNLGVLLPVGLTILAVMVGVALIPRIIWKFF